MNGIKRIGRKSLAKIFRALSNEKRIMIIQTMQMGIDKINDISLNTALPYKTVERHLKILVAAGVAKQIRAGIYFNFQLNDDDTNPHRDTLGVLLKIIGESK